MKNDQKLYAIMTGLGFAERHTGTAMLRLGAAYIAERPTARPTKELYPAIGRASGVSADAAERSMRHAVRCAYCAAPEAWGRFCGPCRPTTSEVIARLGRIVLEN